MWQLLGMLSILASPDVKVIGLYRYPVKGMSADSLEAVVVQQAGETFSDDRRYALLWNKNANKWNEKEPEWLHKENFLCAFTAPKLFSEFVTSYQMRTSNDASASHAVPCDKVGQKVEETQRVLTVRNRSSNELVLGPVNLAFVEGRELLGRFMSEKSGKTVVCVTAATVEEQHKHQFGNTSSSVKSRGDTRTVHIVNAATVRELSSALQTPINPTRFRPNIVIDGLEPWEEFKWVDKSIMCGNMKLSVIQRTVRCEGVSIDPLDPDNVLDIPKLLAKNYPQYGPFFGVYAVIDGPGTISIGDSVSLIK